MLKFLQGSLDIPKLKDSMDDKLLHQDCPGEDSESSVDGFDLNDQQWITANKRKKNRRRNDSSQVMKTRLDDNKIEKSGPAEVSKPSICKGGPGAPSCGKPVTETSIKCRKCQEDYHPMCQMVPVGAVAAVNKFPMLYWFCSSCCISISSESVNGDKSIQALSKQIQDVEKRVLGALDTSNTKSEKVVDQGKKLESKLNLMEDKVKELKDLQAKVDKVLHEQSAAVPKYVSEIQRSAQKIQKFVIDKEDKENRENNILIHNIPECSSESPEVRKKYDSDSFVNIVCALFGGHQDMKVKNVYRLGKRQTTSGGSFEPKPRLLLVKLERKEDVDELLRKRWNLNKVGFSNIYLTRDLAPEERQAELALRQELRQRGKEQYKIFRGKVVLRE